jgi:hypothetical protein
MAITITATVGSASANSFVTEAEAVTYLATRLNRASTWTTVSGSTCTDTEKIALIEATRELTRIAWQGARVDDTQALSWPRNYCVDPDAPLALGTSTTVGYPYYLATEIPDRIKEATIELANEFLKAGTTDLAVADPNAGVIEKTVDVLTTRWASAGSRPTGYARFPRIVALIRPLLATQGGGLDVVRV